ncbi:hypothetical protein [Paraburkholderia caribensis]|uniref:hypothetical protein n=1 Tax=Paraburkholderia caribensis TaxID=75105 RepID=UPI002864110B|nr:hypothetical protein [Paraburkholderia caribensis]MDR6380699.1 hypothetical protein [Paraburkholderia caribensis]
MLGGLATSGWIVDPGIMPLRGLFEREFKEAGLAVPPHPIETASTIATVLMLQRPDTLVSLMPRDMAARLRAFACRAADDRRTDVARAGGPPCVAVVA